MKTLIMITSYTWNTKKNTSPFFYLSIKTHYIVGDSCLILNFEDNG